MASRRMYSDRVTPGDEELDDHLTDVVTDTDRWVTERGASKVRVACYDGLTDATKLLHATLITKKHSNVMSFTSFDEQALPFAPTSPSSAGITAYNKIGNFKLSHVFSRQSLFNLCDLSAIEFFKFHMVSLPPCHGFSLIATSAEERDLQSINACLGNGTDAFVNFHRLYTRLVHINPSDLPLGQSRSVLHAIQIIVHHLSKVVLFSTKTSESMFRTEEETARVTIKHRQIQDTLEEACRTAEIRGKIHRNDYVYSVSFAPHFGQSYTEVKVKTVCPIVFDSKIMKTTMTHCGHCFLEAVRTRANTTLGAIPNVCTSHPLVSFAISVDYFLHGGQPGPYYMTPYYIMTHGSQHVHVVHLHPLNVIDAKILGFALVTLGLPLALDLCSLSQYMRISLTTILNGVMAFFGFRHNEVARVFEALSKTYAQINDSIFSSTYEFSGQKFKPQADPDMKKKATKKAYWDQYESAVKTVKFLRHTLKANDVHHEAWVPSTLAEYLHCLGHGRQDRTTHANTYLTALAQEQADALRRRTGMAQGAGQAQAAAGQTSQEDVMQAILSAFQSMQMSETEIAQVMHQSGYAYTPRTQATQPAQAAQPAQPAQPVQLGAFAQGVQFAQTSQATQPVDMDTDQATTTTTAATTQGTASRTTKKIRIEEEKLAKQQQRKDKAGHSGSN